MYRIIDKINENTFLAAESSRLFVLKKIKPEDAEIYKSLKALDCKYLAKVRELTSIGDSLYAVLDFIQGDTLGDYVAKNGAFSDEEAKRLTIQICLGLKELHALKIVHRDISPKNIIIDDYKNAVIIDFDISRKYKPQSSADTQILGTQGYAAPEQFGFSQTSCRSDIYSVGVLINFMKTGALLTDEKTAGIFAPVVAKCTEIDEYKRYQNVDELLNELDSKKFKIKSRVRRAIPGFRSGKWWHRAISITYYALAVVAIAVITANNILENEAAVTVAFDILALLAALFGIPACVFDSFGLVARLSKESIGGKSKSVFLKIIFSAVCVVVFCLLIYAESILTQ